MTAMALSIGSSIIEQRQENGSQNTQRSYERYLALAQAQILVGDTVGAENYYQHAEHFFRSMSSHPGST
jgi:uncharacterized MAPEG superfamily protein